MTTTLTFRLTTPAGDPVPGGKVIFALSGFDLDAGIVMPAAVEAAVGSDGTGAVTLWPNHSGLRATSYKVTITPAGGIPVEAGSIIVPETTATLPLHLLLPVVPAAGLKSVVLTLAEYEALPVRDAQTLYLIRAEA